MEDWGNFLYRILEKDFEDSAPIKVFLLVRGFNDTQRRLAAATGGRGWRRRSLGVLGKVFGEGRRKKWLFSATGS